MEWAEVINDTLYFVISLRTGPPNFLTAAATVLLEKAKDEYMAALIDWMKAKNALNKARTRCWLVIPVI